MLTLSGIALTVLILGYPWPIAPMGQQHNISGTFCEFREGPPPHFHAAIDIPAPQGTPVYAVEAGYVLWLGSGTNGGVRVGRFAYVHTVPRSDLEIGDYVEQGEIVGYINELNHVHFKDGGGASSYQLKNPLIPDGIEPFVDPYNPTIYQVKFYQDGPGLELDPQHLSGLVDVVVLAMDTTDYGTWGMNNGIYNIGFALYKGDSTVISPHIRYEFNTKPDNSYTLNVYANWSNNGAHYYIITNHVEYSSALNFQELGEGDYTLVVFTHDTENNGDTVVINIHAEPPDTIPPMPPIAVSLTLTEDNRAKFVWTHSNQSDVASFEVFLRFNEAPWTHWATVYPPDTFYISNPLPLNWNFAFKVIAEDWATPPNTSDTSDALVIKNSTINKNTLIVNGNIPGLTANLLWDVVDHVTSSVQTVSKGISPSEPPDFLFLTWGNADTTISSTEENSIFAVLSEDGHILISGSKVVGNMVNDPQYYQLIDSVFGIVETERISRPLLITADPQFLSDWTAYLDDGTHGTYPVDSVDAFVSFNNNAVPILYYVTSSGDTLVSAISFNHTLTFGFPWECIYPLTSKTELLQTIANWAEVSVEENEIHVQNNLLTLTYTEEGRIRLHSKIRFPVTVEVYNSIGRLVKVKEFKNNMTIAGLPSGFYILRAFTKGTLIKTQKFVLIR